MPKKINTLPVMLSILIEAISIFLLTSVDKENDKKQIKIILLSLNNKINPFLHGNPIYFKYTSY